MIAAHHPPSTLSSPTACASPPTTSCWPLPAYSLSRSASASCHQRRPLSSTMQVFSTHPYFPCLCTHISSRPSPLAPLHPPPRNAWPLSSSSFSPMHAAASPSVPAFTCGQRYTTLLLLVTDLMGVEQACATYPPECLLQRPANILILLGGCGFYAIQVPLMFTVIRYLPCIVQLTPLYCSDYQLCYRIAYTPQPFPSDSLCHFHLFRHIFLSSPQRASTNISVRPSTPTSAAFGV